MEIFFTEESEMYLISNLNRILQLAITGIYKMILKLTNSLKDQLLMVIIQDILFKIKLKKEWKEFQESLISKL